MRHLLFSVVLILALATLASAQITMSSGITVQSTSALDGTVTVTVTLPPVQVAALTATSVDIGVRLNEIVTQAAADAAAKQYQQLLGTAQQIEAINPAALAPVLPQIQKLLTDALSAVKPKD